MLAAAPCPAAAQDEVPFITTPDHVTLAMLRIAAVGPRDHVIDLGSGDGRIVITAARHFGASGLGVEIVPDLVQRSREAARRAGVASRARFAEQDLFRTDLSPATVVTMYLLQDVNLQLRPALLALQPGTRIVSHDWDMGDWLPDRSLTLAVPDKAVGREKLSRVHFWWVPAPVQGIWCGPRGQRLELQQRHQVIDGHAVDRSGQRIALSGRLQGRQLQLLGAQGPLQAEWQDAATMTIRQASGAWRMTPGQRWQRRDCRAEQTELCCS
ncbi:MAG: class I SAM-dependent methyltransferase [Rubrivivax sp.]|nr:class I SAM-dependent methyltransferase [Rubrivivax sp.]